MSKGTFREYLAGELRECEITELSESDLKKEFIKSLKELIKSHKLDTQFNPVPFIPEWIDRLPDSKKGELLKSYKGFDDIVFISLTGERKGGAFIEPAKAAIDASKFAEEIKKIKNYNDVVAEIALPEMFWPFWPNGFEPDKTKRKNHFVKNIILLKYK